MKTFFTLFALVLLSLIELKAQNCNNYWAVVSPDGNYVYFSSDRQGNGWDIYRIDIDGSNLLHMTDLPGNEFFPSISPDGSKVIFQHGDYGVLAEIYVMDNDGNNLVRITENNLYDGSPSYSPDGLHILFSAWDTYNYPEIFLMNPDGTNRQQLTEMGGAFWNSAPRFHPSGEKIYFQAGFNADDHLAMINPDGSGWTDITEANDFGYADANVFFNTDGSKMSFFNTDKHGYNSGGDLVLANADGTGWTYISNSNNNEYFYQASFHPTNDKLYISHLPSASGKWNIFSMQQDGSNLVPLTNCSLAGIGEVDGTSWVELSPNPVKDYLNVTVKGISNIESVEVVTLTGQVQQKFDWTSNQSQQQINVQTVPEGVYFLRLITKSQDYTRKLMIIR